MWQFTQSKALLVANTDDRHLKSAAVKMTRNNHYAQKSALGKRQFWFGEIHLITFKASVTSKDTFALESAHFIIALLVLEK